MGNKAAKQYYLKKKYGVQESEENSFDEDLSVFLAALSNMTHKGSQSTDETSARVTRDDISLTGPRHSSTTATPTRSAGTVREKRKRLTRSKAVSDDISLHRSQRERDNSQDWAEMREWLLWCMQSNLKEDLDICKHNRIENQSSMESNAET